MQAQVVYMLLVSLCLYFLNNFIRQQKGKRSSQLSF